MTIGAWIVAGIIGFTGLIIAGVLAWSGIRGSEKSFVVCGIAAALITALVCAAFVWWRSNSESGKRALKDQQSNLNGGIERTVCQRQFEIVRKRRRNFVIFRRGGGNKIKRFLAQKECSRFAVSGA